MRLPNGAYELLRRKVSRPNTRGMRPTSRNTISEPACVTSFSALVKKKLVCSFSYVIPNVKAVHFLSKNCLSLCIRRFCVWSTFSFVKEKAKQLQGRTRKAEKPSKCLAEQASKCVAEQAKLNNCNVRIIPG